MIDISPEMLRNLHEKSFVEFSAEKFVVQKENLPKNYNQRIREANERYAPYLFLKDEGIEVEEMLDKDDIADTDFS